MSSKKRSTTTKKQARKPLANPEYNIKNPEIADKVELAFKAGGKNFYRFAADFRMPTGRYKWVMNYLREVDLRCDVVTMKREVQAAMNHIDGSKNSINTGKAYLILYNILGRLNLGFEPETVKRLASVTYFDETEDLSDFDMNKGQEKIAIWNKNKTLDFFLTRPMSELLGLNNISPESLQDYIDKTTEIIKELTVAQQSLLEDTSESGKKTLSTSQTETPI